MTDGTRFRDARLAWTVGGALLAASAVVGPALGPAAMLVPGVRFLGALCFAAATLILALGLRGAGSVTDRRPLGTIALVGLGVWPLVVIVVGAVLPPAMPVAALQAWGYADSIIRLALAVLAVTGIARAGAVAHPWNRAPAWVLAAVAGVRVLEFAVVATRPAATSPVILLLPPLETLVSTGGIVFLGVLAIVLAHRRARPGSVVVFASSDEDVS